MKANLSAAIAARAVLSGAFTPDAVADVLAALRGRPATKSLTRLAHRLVQALGEGTRPRLREVSHLLQSSSSFARLFPGITMLPPPATMQPAAGAPRTWQLPAITNLTELRDWLGVTAPTLHNLSSPWRSDHEAGGRLQHYRYRWIPRQGRLPRLIEAPLPRLKALQQRILHGILDLIPAHPAAHGFVKGRDIVSLAAPHTGQACVLRMDIQDFFPTLRCARVRRVFLTAGYPEEVASVLAGLCSTVTPAAVRHAGLAAFPPELAWPLRQRLQSRHLPQGSPASPALANLCAFALDTRLGGLARQFDARYTRYADDLLFSGGGSFRHGVSRCAGWVGAILLDEGFVAACRKTRIMPHSVSQRAAGLVLNQHAAVPRRERDELKAILTNCLRHGPASQNLRSHPDFRAHLLGRITQTAHVHPAHGAKLRALFDAIAWDPDAEVSQIRSPPDS